MLDQGGGPGPQSDVEVSRLRYPPIVTDADWSSIATIRNGPSEPLIPQVTCREVEADSSWGEQTSPGLRVGNHDGSAAPAELPGVWAVSLSAFFSGGLILFPFLGLASASVTPHSKRL